MSLFVIDSIVHKNTKVKWFFKDIVTFQEIYLNGYLLSTDVAEKGVSELAINSSHLKPGKNTIIILGKPLKKKNEWDIPNKQPGYIQLVTPAEKWRRKLFNGLAQVIIQSTYEEGEIILKASSYGLKDAELKINVN